MSITQRVLKPHVITIGLLLLLACGPLNRVLELDQKSRILATSVAVIGEGDYVAFEAYENLQRLPNYHLESWTVVRDKQGNLLVTTVTVDHDSQGNSYSVTQTPDEQLLEHYVIDGHTYIFEPNYAGWINLDLLSSQAAASPLYDSATKLSPIENIIRLLPQFGTVPTESGRELLQGRPATRYELTYVTADLTEAFGAQTARATDLRGTLWVDDQTGALLKSEILLYEDSSRQSQQEFHLETTEIGSILPIKAPAPIVDPNAIVSATATAQAWSVLQVEVIYRGQPIHFELVPVQISQTPNSAEMQLYLHHLPTDLQLETETEPLLSDLSQQLTLSIPTHNLVTRPAGFRVNQINTQNHSVEVIYLFTVDLESFNHVELIIAGPGNPLFAPVPVAENE